MNLKKILMPTDFSKPANHALSQAVALALKYDAELIVLHARVMYEDDPANLTAKIEALKDEERKIEEDLLQKLRNCTEHHKQLNVKHEIVRGYSSPSAILSYLNNNPFDLVVIGTHGRTGLGHFLIGSVTEKVVRYSPSPVLTIAPESTITDQFKRILVPFDFSEHAKMAYQSALNIADNNQAQITLLYVLNRESHPEFYSWGMSDVFETIPDIEQKARAQLEKVIQEIPNPDGVAIQTEVTEGVPHKGIKEYADEHELDLLIIATHGRVGLDRFLLGSTTEKVIRSVPLPILTLKQQSIL
ncbi:MAG: hypothetical protein GF313_12410 [Caldithrix sp.]|nr:hypothetical protein [Caldithrix sp.]